MRKSCLNSTIKILSGWIASLILCSTLQGQVSLMPYPTQQFMDTNGNPCAGCLVFTYQSGTNTPLATYTDFTGAVSNSNPVVLDGAGYPSASGSRVGIWLSNGLAYRIQLTLPNFTQLYELDGIVGAAPSVAATAGNQAVTTVTFSPTPIFTATGQAQVFKITLTGNVISSTLIMAGIVVPSYVTFEVTQDNVGSHTLVWPVNVLGAGTVLATANVTSTQTFLWDGVSALPIGPMNTGASFISGTYSGPNLVQPLLNGGSCPAVNGFGAYSCFTNAAGGTVTNGLVVYDASNPSKAVKAPAAGPGAEGGVIGICVQACGTSGTAVVQQSGAASCVFDNATTAGDWAINSASVAGDCSDSGVASSTRPPGGIVGVVTATNGAPGTNPILITSVGLGVIASGTQAFIAGGVTAGTCVTVTSTATGAVSGQTVAWTYIGTLSVADITFIVFPQITPNTITWNICNESGGLLSRSGNASVAWRVLQ